MKNKGLGSFIIGFLLIPGVILTPRSALAGAGDEVVDPPVDPGVVVVPEDAPQSIVVDPDVDPAEEADTAPTGTVRSASGDVKWLNCKVQATNPHWSDGAQGMIAKFKYFDCTGNAVGTLFVSGWLYKDENPGQVGPYVPKASELGQGQQISPGSWGRFYVPAEPKKGIACNMKHKYWAQWQSNIVIMGIPGSSKSMLSKTVPPKRCG